MKNYLAALLIFLLAAIVQGVAAPRGTVQVAAPSAVVGQVAVPSAVVGQVAAPAAAPMQDRAAELLERLAAGFRAMDAYTVRFEIGANETVVCGSYSVRGADYYLHLGDAEVFSDGTVRYEVDNRRREVTIVEVDTVSRNILNNPVRAFDFLDSEYAPKFLGERGGNADILLTPTDDGAMVTGAVTLTLSLDPVRPVRLVYDYDGERIEVLVTGIAPLHAPLKTFDRANYPDYEFIDFR